MRSLKKSPEPRSLINWRLQNPGAPWDALGKEPKEDLQTTLCVDQSNLCAFCESRIEPNGRRMRIGHWVPRSLDPSRTFDWQNHWGSCPEEDEKRCDVAQADRRLLFLDPYHQPHLSTLVQFREMRDLETGLPGVRIFCRDCEDGETDLETLNLNGPRLAQNRARALKEAKSQLAKQLGSGGWSRSRLERLRGLIEKSQAPYRSCVLYFVDRWIQQR